MQVYRKSFVRYIKHRGIFGLCAILVVLSFTGCGLQLDKLQLQNRVKETFEEQVGNIVVGKAEVVETISAARFAYALLDEESQIAYDQMLDCILKHEEKVIMATKDVELMKHAYDAILIDYGGLFWVSGYQYNTHSSFDNIVGIEFMPTYVYSLEERAELQMQVDAVVAAWLAEIPENASAYEKTKCVFEMLIDKVDYDLESRDNQNILSVFLYGETVCQGYADATQYLLNELGITCGIVTGTAEGTNHAWNIVELEGNYYYTDTTWGNSKFRGESLEEFKHVNYAYLNTTYEEISKNHQASEVMAWPESQSMDCTYFCKEGLYFETYDADVVGERIRSAWNDGASRLSLKFASDEAYQKALDELITNNQIFHFCHGLRSIAYIDEHNICVLTLIFQ